MYNGKKVILRSLELEDVNEIQKYFNDLRLRKTLFSNLPFTKEQEIEWIRKSWKDRMNGDAYHFSITNKEGKWLGSCGLTIKKPWRDRRAEMGIAIFDLHEHGKGYGTDAVKAICSFGFNQLNLNSIFLHYLEYNIAGERAYIKAGFTKTGSERQAIFKDGKFVNYGYMDILANEFNEKFPNYSLYPSE